MKGYSAGRVRGTTWAFAALSLIVFCWLGLLAFKIGPIFHGLKAPLPPDTRLVVLTYGPAALPVFGVVAASLMILSDFFLPRRWLPTVFASICMLLAMLAFRALTTPVIAISSTIRP